MTTLVQAQIADLRTLTDQELMARVQEAMEIQKRRPPTTKLWQDASAVIHACVAENARRHAPKRYSVSRGKPRREEYKAPVTAMLAKGVRPHFYADWVAMTEALEGKRSCASVRVAKRAARIVK